MSIPTETPFKLFAGVDMSGGRVNTDDATILAQVDRDPVGPGALGAAWATVAGYAVLCALTLIYAQAALRDRLAQTATERAS